ncbi:MAG: formyl transferase, partial [Gammaproteobacteria bacterium]|nr:formyl transferase [Gammaproteobacteria bacterium]
HCLFRGQEVKIWKVESGRPVARNVEPGKVLSVRNGVIEVKCGDASIRVVEHHFPPDLPGEQTYL